MRWLIGAFLLTPLKKLSQKCFFTMLFNYLCEIDKYTLLLLFVLLFFVVPLCVQDFILAGIVNDAVQLAVSN